MVKQEDINTEIQNEPKAIGTKNHPKKHHVTKWVLLLFTVVSMGFLGGWLGARVYLHGPVASTTMSNEKAKRVVNEESQLISSIASRVGPSVVSINTTSRSNARDAFSGQTVTEESAGTGFIVSESGYILTNRHVIPTGATSLSVTLSDGTELSNVEVVGRTSDNDSLDVAFLKIKDAKGKKLVPVKIGDSDKMQVGDMVVAIGNALGQFQNTVTSGIVSGYGRSVEAQDGVNGVESLQNLLQTDAAINEGNSGGPLVNSNGEVIGMNTAIAGSGQNIGFAIPLNDVAGLVKGVLTQGKLLRAYLGVHYVQLTPELAKSLGLKQDQGAYISEADAAGAAVVPGSPANLAGLQPKDIIIKIDDQDITQKNTLSSVIGRFSVGQKIRITYVRGGKYKTVETKLVQIP